MVNVIFCEGYGANESKYMFDVLHIRKGCGMNDILRPRKTSGRMNRSSGRMEKSSRKMNRSGRVGRR
jgi:hypothetical protein